MVLRAAVIGLLTTAALARGAADAGLSPATTRPATQSAAQPAATQPADVRPVAEKPADAQRLAMPIRQLNADSAADREAARAELMALSPDDLPALRAAIAAAQPLRASQADALRSVIVHVLTRRAVLKTAPGKTAFLGLSFPKFSRDLDGEPAGSGAVVMAIVPGFAASRFVRPGDILLGFKIDGQTEWIGGDKTVFQIIGGLVPGTRVEVFATRDGRPLNFTVALDARPDFGLRDPELESPRLQALADEAEEQAQYAYDAEYRVLIGGN